MRLFIIVAVFLLLGLMNAPLAKFTPQILEMAGVGGLTGVGAMPEPQSLDAWIQFISNVGQMGVLTILLVCGGVLSGERSRGTLILPLTRGLGRTGVVLVKFLVSSALWTTGILIAALTSWFYTELLFPGSTVENLAWMILFFWFFGEFLLALIPLSSVLIRGSMSGLIIPGGVLFILLVLSAFPDLFFWNPLLLVSDVMGLLIETKTPADFLAPCLCAAFVATGSLLAALLRFKKSAI
jgi:ABC-2 type transport system permease protein